MSGIRIEACEANGLRSWELLPRQKKVGRKRQPNLVLIPGWGGVEVESRRGEPPHPYSPKDKPYTLNISGGGERYITSSAQAG